MTDAAFDLVHVNVAIARYPSDHPAMADFNAQGEAVNRAAQESPGFLWTPTGGEAGDGAAVFGHPLTLANISTWQSIEALWRFSYSGLHHRALGRRREWFEPPSGPGLALWWAPRGARPTFAEAKDRIDRLAAEGPTPYAFTFKDAFDAAGNRHVGLVRGIRVGGLTTT